MIYTRDALIEDLRFGACEIIFTKVDGTERKLRCTLMDKYLPPKTTNGDIMEEHKKPENLDLVAAWDLEAGGWRSFRVDSVKYAQAIDGY